MEFKDNLTQISHLYDYFIFDIWGVIHDGSQAYPGAVEAVSYLRSQNKKICFLSNAPRRSQKAAMTLEKFGIAPDLYDFILTSGEAAYLDLERNQQNGFKDFGKNYFYIGPEKDLDLLDGLNYNIVTHAKDADFALTTGFNEEHSTLEEKLPQIKDAVAYNLPLLCVNPDMLVVKQSGLEMLCAGVIAQEYKRLSGKVFYYGKPHDAVYNLVFKRFNNDTSKTLAIGDALETDIKGALHAKIDCALITGGILSKVFNVKNGQKADEATVKKVCQEYGLSPHFILPKI